MPIALYHEWQSYPTILHFADQCALMRWLWQIPLAEIQQQPALLQHIQISHQHNGVFELGEADAPMFAEFVAWVKGLLVYNLDFSQYTDSLGVRFAIAG
ncbi:hypothetical protein [Kingella bonacorsii]|jgi:hypothetical protein|uniref:Uncharacterized protein n=1 Tax=Kingella bonacorsii TaxID=2796361 RepID=A0ABS1BSD4_9NEIS|nr:hypothetical protein [Kingella bonacorsii]MBK0396142.1 hypothetical protein [Kingella bonacorsii]